VLHCVAVCCSVLQRVAVCCSVLQGVAYCCSVLQCVAVCCILLQCVAVCCSVLQCVAAKSCSWNTHDHFAEIIEGGRKFDVLQYLLRCVSQCVLQLRNPPSFR